MTYRLAAAIAIAAAAPAAIAQAPQPLQQIQQHLRTLDTMTADFAQTDRNGRVLKGTLTMKRPGRVRFQYEKGVPLLIVGDGKALTMIDYSVKQVSRWPIGSSPLSVLVDPGRDIAGFAKLVPSGDPNTLLIEGKDRKHPEFGTITIAFQQAPGAPAGLRLAGWSVLDAQGNRSAVRLSNQRFGVAVGDQTFRWSDPRSRGPRS
ncbi:MAG: outer membrane lipoprotein carrier protein LolA [Sphingomonas fennica]